MEMIKNLINSIHTNDTLASMQQFEAIWNQKVMDAIQTKRQSVGATLFGEAEEITEGSVFSRSPAHFKELVKKHHGDKDVEIVSHPSGDGKQVTYALGKTDGLADKNKVLGKHTSYDDGDEDGEVKINEGFIEEDFDIKDFSVEELQEYTESEEFNKLDEISKQTLGSYIEKAHADSALKTDTAAHAIGKGKNYDKAFSNYKAADKRTKGISKAVAKLVANRD